MVCQSSTSGPAISGTEVAELAREAGFSGQSLIDIVAITNRESSFNPTALNNCDDTQDYSVGLAQINLYGPLINGRIQQLQSLGLNVHSLSDAVNALKDPLTNLKMAWLISSGGNPAGFQQGWAVQGGTYLTDTNVPLATQIVNNMLGNSPGEEIPPPPTGDSSGDNTTGFLPGIPGLGGINDFFSALIDAAKAVVKPTFWFRIFFILGGTIIALLGVYILANGIINSSGSGANIPKMPIME